MRRVQAVRFSSDPRGSFWPGGASGGWAGADKCGPAWDGAARAAAGFARVVGTPAMPPWVMLAEKAAREVGEIMRNKLRRIG